MKTFNIREYDIDKIVAVDIFVIRNFGCLMKLKKVMSTFLGSIFKKYKINVRSNNVQVLFIKTQDRKDYNNLFDEIFSCCKQSKEILEIEAEYGLSIAYVIDFIKNIKTLIYLIKRYGFLDGLYAFIRIVRYITTLMGFQNICFNNLVVFSEVQPFENFVVQYCNKIGVNTVTLQHGLYIDYDREININKLNYLNVKSKYLLAWGQSTKELFHKYNNDLKVELCGKPIQTIPRTNDGYNTIAVVLDQVMYKEYNQKLIDIASNISNKIDCNICIRVHPSDNLSNYIYDPRLASDKCDIFNSRFVLAHTTSMIYEYLSLGCRVYKLESNIPANKISKDLMFKNSNELLKLLGNDFDFLSEARFHIYAISDSSKLLYEKFFNKL